MIFSWFFRRQKKTDDNRLTQITQSLKASFSNIKKDMNDVFSRLAKLSDSNKEQILRLDQHDQRFSQIDAKLDHFVDILDVKKAQKIKSVPTILLKPITETQIKTIFDTLTDTQQKLFIAIFQLQRQLDKKSVSLKSLAKILYPEKIYSEVRSTISEYLTIISELGLVEKYRRGRETYVGLTEYGRSLISDKIKKKKAKAKIKIKE